MLDMEMVTVRMHIKLDDFVKKGEYIFFHSVFFRILLALLILLAVISFWKGELQEHPPVMEILGAILGYSAIIVAILAIVHKLYVGYLRSEKELFPQIQQLSFEEYGLRRKSDLYEVYLDWSLLTTIKETDKYIFFNRKKANYFTVYKHLITGEELASIRSFLQNHPEAKGKLKNF